VANEKINKIEKDNRVIFFIKKTVILKLIQYYIKTIYNLLN